MPAAGQTKVNFNDKFFDDILHSAGVESMCLSKAQQALANVRATAPVDTGAYRNGFSIEVHKSAYRNSYRVVGHDWKTILLECKGGYLARALKAVK